MLDVVAVVTALIIDRPLCMRCVTEKAATTPAELQAAIERIQRVLTLHRDERARCHACGTIGPVIFLGARRAERVDLRAGRDYS